MAKLEFTSLEVASPDHGEVPNRLLKQADEAHALVVILPGLNYTCDNPLLYYLSRLAVDRSADVLQLWANYTLAEFQSLSNPDQVKWLLEDARALLEAGRKFRTYDRLILAGKSIGTLTLGVLFEQDKALAGTPAIWLTPLFHHPTVLNSALHARGSALFIGGTADPTFAAAALQQLHSIATAQTVAIPGADHSLEIPGEALRSLDVLKEVMAAMAAFLDEVLLDQRP
jgi:hypothetical protein